MKKIKFKMNISTLIEKVQIPSKIDDYECISCTILNLIRQIDEKLLKSVDKNLNEQFENAKKFILQIFKEKADCLLEDIVLNIINYCDDNNLKVLNLIDFKKIKSQLIKSSRILELPSK